MDARPIVRVMIRIPRQALSTFWVDAGKAMLVTAIPCLAFDRIALQGGAGLLAFLFLTAGILLVPLMIFAAASLVLFLFRRPGWLLGPVFMLILNSAFLHLAR